MTFDSSVGVGRAGKQDRASPYEKHHMLAAHDHFAAFQAAVPYQKEELGALATAKVQTHQPSEKFLVSSTNSCFNALKIMDNENNCRFLEKSILQSTLRLFICPVVTLL